MIHYFLDQFNRSIEVSDPKAVGLLLDCDEDYIGTDDILITDENQVRYSRICKPYTLSFRRNSVFLSKFQVPLLQIHLTVKFIIKMVKQLFVFQVALEYVRSFQSIRELAYSMRILNCNVLSMVNSMESCNSKIEN